MSLMDRLRNSESGELRADPIIPFAPARKPDTADLEQALIPKTPSPPPIPLDDLHQIITKDFEALVAHHSEHLARAKSLFDQIERCLEAARAAREAMLKARTDALVEPSLAAPAARKEALGEEEPPNDL